MPPRMGQSRTYAPDAAEIERLADAAIAALPEPFRSLLEGVVLPLVARRGVVLEIARCTAAVTE